MRVFTLLTAVALLGLMLAAGPAAAATETDLTGSYTGEWTCPDGEIKSGTMTATLKQDGDRAMGTADLKGTIEGDISGRLVVTKMEGNNLMGEINTGSVIIRLDGTYNDSTITGNYSSDIGNGSYSIHR